MEDYRDMSITTVILIGIIAVFLIAMYWITAWKEIHISRAAIEFAPETVKEDVYEQAKDR